MTTHKRRLAKMGVLLGSKKLKADVQNLEVNGGFRPTTDAYQVTVLGILAKILTL